MSDHQKPPPHADSVRLAEMLLDAGADPNDNQTLYNRMFKPDNSHLSPMLAHGLGRDLPSPWRDRFESAYPSPEEKIGEHLRSAAASGYTERVRLLLAHGVDPNTQGYHPTSVTSMRTIRAPSCPAARRPRSASRLPM